LHPTVTQRFNWPGGVLQYDEIAAYRPEALRHHNSCSQPYADIPLPHRTCWQRLWAAYRASKAQSSREIQTVSRTTMDRFVSCIALFVLLAALLAGTGTLVFQIVGWLETGHWPIVNLDTAMGWLRHIGSDWVGLQKIWDWVLALPLFVVLYVVGFVLFWLLGVLSASLYRTAARAQMQTITPSQTNT
jgi:hypothetical protein